MRMKNGEEYYRRFLEGDQTAFTRLVEIYFDNLTFFIKRYVRDFTTAEDIAMDSMLELIIHKKRYDFRCSLKTYLFMLGRSKALNYLKRNKRIVLTENDSNYFTNLQDSTTPESELLLSERKVLINNALKDLPSDMREAVYLVYFEDQTYEQVAKIMKKNVKQIDNLLYRAKIVLRTILKKEVVE